MAHGVLDQRLKQQHRYLGVEYLGGGVDLDLQTITEADSLDLEIAAAELELGGERARLRRRRVEGETQEIRETAQHPVRVVRAALGDQRRDRVEGVEQEMGMQLQAQRLEPSFARQRLGATHPRALGRDVEVGRNPEVERAPGEQHEGVVDRVAEIRERHRREPGVAQRARQGPRQQRVVRRHPRRGEEPRQRQRRRCDRPVRRAGAPQPAEGGTQRERRREAETREAGLVEQREAGRPVVEASGHHGAPEQAPAAELQDPEEGSSAR
jgi:hypothetical protein